jgi:putative Mg2+ transporter-C (MgtC) family protein
MQNLVVHAFGDSEVEIATTLVSQPVNREELDQLVSKLKEKPVLRQAFRSPSTLE